MVIIKITPFLNENSPIADPNYEMGVEHAFEHNLEIIDLT